MIFIYLLAFFLFCCFLFRMSTYVFLLPFGVLTTNLPILSKIIIIISFVGLFHCAYSANGLAVLWVYIVVITLIGTSLYRQLKSS